MAFQLALVNVTLAVDNDISSVGEVVMLKITSLMGLAFKTIVKLAVCVAASVKFPVILDRVKPGISLSAFSTLTVCEAKPVKAGSELALTEAVIETVWVPSTNNSSTVVRDTV